jgi:hypothetical protein
MAGRIMRNTAGTMMVLLKKPGILFQSKKK